MALKWLSHVQRTNLMYQASLVYMRKETGQISRHSTIAGQSRQVEAFLSTVRANFGNNGIALLSGNPPAKANTDGDVVFHSPNLFHVGVRSRIRQAAQSIEPDEIPAEIIQSFIDQYRAANRVNQHAKECSHIPSVLAFDGCILKMGLYFDSSGDCLEGSVIRVTGAELRQIFFPNNIDALNAKVKSLVGESTLVDTALQFYLTSLDGTAQVPIAFQFRKKFADFNEACKCLEILIARIESMSCHAIKIAAVCSDSESAQAKAARHINSTEGLHYCMLPDPIHMVKSFFNSFTNWILSRNDWLLSLTAVTAILDLDESDEDRQFLCAQASGWRTAVTHRDKHNPAHALLFFDQSCNKILVAHRVCAKPILTTIYPRSIPKPGLDDRFDQSIIISSAIANGCLLSLSATEIFTSKLKECSFSLFYAMSSMSFFSFLCHVVFPFSMPCRFSLFYALTRLLGCTDCRTY